MTTPDLPPAAIVVTHKIADWDRWKQVFDAHETARRDHGILGHHINRGEDDPNAIMIYMAVGDVEAARAFSRSPDLKSAMEEAGITSAPDFTWVTPVREAVVWDRELPAMAVRHPVADFDRWLEGYDAANGLRASAGILGHAANRSLDDPGLVIVYHQAEAFETLKSFLSNPDLKGAMERAGVTGEPEVTFHTGGFGKIY